MLAIFKKGITASLMCKLCGKAPDSIDHALWNCVKIKPGRYNCPFFNSLVSFKASDFLDICLWVFSTIKADWTPLFLAIVWCAWGYRNLLVHGGSFDVPNLWARTKTFLRNFNSASFSPKMPSAPSQRSQIWRPPDSGFKVNVDTTLDKSRGILVWVWWLETKWAGVKCFNSLIKAEIAETLAILEGVHLAISENFNPVIVESDAINAINLCSGISLSRCEVDNIVQDVHDFIRESTNISLCFSLRSCNLVAHSVAKWALGSGSSTFWISSFLDWLCKLIKEDGFVDLSVV
ncbi:hypothetical protein LWI29_033206 [Acer saccharum]|uniref:RNase H type-1 domain-containing protein n=1 Tax=Acer saccharum TaxID=4024 RepID=A0AA39W4M1_ACESA|nr:hypothetical protein LWI29_033206 [Acer saccharum]